MFAMFGAQSVAPDELILLTKWVRHLAGQDGCFESEVLHLEGKIDGLRVEVTSYRKGRSYTTEAGLLE